MPEPPTMLVRNGDAGRVQAGCQHPAEQLPKLLELSPSARTRYPTQAHEETVEGLVSLGERVDNALHAISCNPQSLATKCSPVSED